MEIGKIITLDDDKDYLLLDQVELDDSKYLYTVEVDKEDMPNGNYHFFLLVEEDDGDYTEEIDDKDVIESITSILTVKYLNDSLNADEEQAA